MRNITVLALGIGLLAPICHAESRWCTVTGRGQNDILLYPDFARRARLFGVVRSRISFSSDGEVTQVDLISGPRLLGDFLGQQLKTWKLKTDAEEPELCQTIVVAEFKLDYSSQWRNPESGESSAPTVLRLSVDSEPYLVETSVDTQDPIVHPGFTGLIRNIGRALKQAFGATKTRD